MPGIVPREDFKIAVLISGGGSNLQAIIDQIQARELDAKITSVISDQPDAYGLERARLANIPTYVVKKTKGEKREQYDARLSPLMIKHKVDLIVLAGFMRILSAQFVEQFAGKIINLHPSLLPAYKGLNTHARVIKDKAPYHGASVHFVTAGLDEGPLIIQDRLKVNPEDTAQSLQARVHQIEHQILPQAIALIRDGKAQLSA